MKPQDVALWLGIASSIGGAAIGYGTLTEKVSTLEQSTDATHLESRLTKLEVRSEDADLGHISTEIQKLRGEHEKLADKVAAIRIPNTSAVKTDVRVLQSKVDSLQVGLKDLSNSLDSVKSANKPLL